MATSYGDQLVCAIEAFLPPRFFAGCACPNSAAVGHPNGWWLMALLMPLQEPESITKRFEITREFWRSRKQWRRFPTSYTGFTKALKQGRVPNSRHCSGRHFEKQLPELLGSRWR